MDTEPIAPLTADDQAAGRNTLEQLRTFLDDQNATCPLCSYSLQGIKDARCPECGWAITLRPSEGLDRRRIIQMTRWFAYAGLILSVPETINIVRLTLLANTQIMWHWRSIVYQAGNGVLLVLSMFVLIGLIRGARQWSTRLLLKRTRQYAAGIIVVLALSRLIPFSVNWILWFFR